MQSGPTLLTSCKWVHQTNSENNKNFRPDAGSPLCSGSTWIVELDPDSDICHLYIFFLESWGKKQVEALSQKP